MYTGFEPHLQTNYVFGESDFAPQNEEVEDNDKEHIQHSGSSSSSDSRTKQDLVDPFDSSNSNNKKLSEKFVIPDIFGTEGRHPSTSTSTDPASTKSSDSQPELQSESELGIQSQYKSSSDNVEYNNSIGQNTNESFDGNDTVLGTDIQADTANSDNTNAKVNEKVTVSAGQPNNNNQSGFSTSSESESQSSIQPRYKSYRDYLDNNTKNDNIIQTDDKPVTETDDKPVTETGSMDWQVSAFGDRVSDTTDENANASEYPISAASRADFNTESRNSNVNGKANETVNEVTFPENQSTTKSNPTTGSQFQVDKQSSNSNSTVKSQQSYKSYKEFIDHNKANKSVNSDNDLSSKSAQELGSTDVSSSQVTAQSSDRAYGDFDGDGKDDLAIGVPNENDDAGAVNVIYGSSSGLSATTSRADQFWTQNSADVNDVSEMGDEFGSSLTSGDFNGDGKDDLAIGVRGEDIGSATDAGAVNVIYGSGAGLHALLSPSNQFWTQNSADVNDVSETFDTFGSSLSSGDFNGDGKDDLAIGVSNEDDGAGAVNVLYGTSSGLSATSPRSDQFWTQNSPDVPDGSESGDSFGRSLTSGDFNNDGKDDLAIGVPDEGLRAGLTNSVGGVEVIYGSSSGLSATSSRSDQFWTQDSANIDDVAENNNAFGFSLTSGDFNDDGKDDLAIGIRWEQISSKSEVGAVEVIYGSSSGLSATSPRADQFWTQDSANVNDVTESEDQFGYSLSSGDYNGDGKDDLAIGVWWEDVDIGGADVDDAGGVEVIYGSSSGLSATSPRVDQFWTQDSVNIDDVPERPDEFGAAVYSGDFNGDGKDDLAVGVPQEDVGSISSAGAVEVIYGSSSGLSATSTRPDQFWTQNTADVNDASESGDHLGEALG